MQTPQTLQTSQISKDVYEYIGQFANDKDILNMLSVNKSFNDPIFFQRALQRKYPFLLEFKTKDVSWRQFYVSGIYYISKLEEFFINDPMIPKSLNPRNIDMGSLLWDEALKAALASNDYGLITFFTDKLEYTGLRGFLLPLFVKQPLIDFIFNANFADSSGVSLKEVLRPLLTRGVFNYAILSQLFNLYFKRNNLEKANKRYSVDENMNKYLAPYLNSLESTGKFDRNLFRFSDIPKIFLLGTYKDERQVDDKTRRLLFGLNKVLNTIFMSLLE